jgi:Major Facilitator Superfamily
VTTTDKVHAGRYRDAFASTEFRALFGALIVSMLGNVVASLAIVVLVYRRTNSPLLSALTFTTMFVPYLLGGTLLSGLVDRVPVRRLLVCCDLGGAVLVAVMTVPGLPVPALFALLFGLSLLMPLSTGARSALLPRILAPGVVVPARSLFRMVSQGGQIAGYAVGGGLLADLSPHAVLGVGVATYAVSACVLRVFLGAHPKNARGDRPGASLAADSLHGVGQVLRDRPLRRVLLLGWLVPLLMVVPEALAAPSAAARGLPSSATGWWLAAGPVGTVAGELAGVWLVPAARRGGLTTPLAACGFVPFLVFVLDPSLAPALVLLAASGLCGAYLLGLDQLLLDVTPPDLLGRAYTVNTSVLMATQGLGFAAAGAVAELVSPDRVIAAAGVAGLVTVAVLRAPRGVTRAGRAARAVRRESAAGPGRRRAAS